MINHAKAFAVIWSALFKNAIRQLGRNKQMARGRLHDLCFTSKVIFLKAEMICKRWLNSLVKDGIESLNLCFFNSLTFEKSKQSLFTGYFLPLNVKHHCER